MRKLYVLLAFLMVSFSSVFGQEVEMGNAELLPILCHNWEMEFASMLGNKMKQNPGAANTEFDFKNDGTYLLLGNDGSKSKGAWRLNKDMKYVELLIQGKEVSRIKSVSEQELVMVLPTGKGASAQMQGIEIHFKRKL